MEQAMQKLLFITLVYSLFWMACKKTEAPEGIDSPVFMVTYSGDSTPITVTAGLDGVYHFTHYTVVDQEFFHSINTFADAQCPAGDCPGSLGFEFRNQVNNDIAC